MVWPEGHQLQNGKYTIDEVIGQGGFGITYKARHRHLNSFVVIKTPNEYLKHDPEYEKYVRRFVKEAQMLENLCQEPHPHIVRTRDLFEEPGTRPGERGTHCLVMDFVPGETLMEAVRRRGKRPEAEAVRYVRQIGEALAWVHRAGLVHRDAHPGNIILRQDGRTLGIKKAILIDFRFAKELTPAFPTTMGKGGNKVFAPYEQLTQGSRKPVADIYCLAATFYYVLTGECPPTSLERKLHEEPFVEPQQIVPGISDNVNRAILEGMELEPENRPQSMEEWLQLLEISRAEPIRWRLEKRNRSKKRKIQADRLSLLPLVAIIVIYGVIGGTLATASSPWYAWAGAVVLPIVWAVSFVYPSDWNLAMAGFISIALGVALVWTGNRVLIGIVGLLGSVSSILAIVPMVIQQSRLDRYLKLWHTYLIFTGLSVLGLGLGALVVFALQ